jgi:hypothetical protein
VRAALRGSALLAALALSGGAACGGPPPTPEEEVRATLAAAEAAVRAHDLGALKDLVASDYRDAAGRDKAELGSLLTAHFLRNSSIHLLVRVKSLEVQAPGRATVEALLATAGRPIPGLEALAELDAELLWLDLGLARRDGEWAVTSARWERARLEDLL